MGWISKRHMESGGSIGPGMSAKNANRGPLRKIIRLIRRSESMFEPDRVGLECGHEGNSWGGLRARCRRCLKAIQPHGAGGTEGGEGA